MKKEKIPPYCVRHEGFFIFKTFDEALKKLTDLSVKCSSEDYDEVLVNISLGRNCNDRDRCQPCIFRRKKKQRPENPHNSSR